MVAAIIGCPPGELLGLDAPVERSATFEPRCHIDLDLEAFGEGFEAAGGSGEAVEQRRDGGAHAAIAAPARPSGPASATTAASLRPRPPRPRAPNGIRLSGLPVRSSQQALLRGPVEPGQYTSFDYGETLEDHGVLQSTGSVGDAYDNALAESWVDSLKTELIADRVWRTRAQLELAVVEYIGWFNHVRLHSSLGFVPPVEHELRWRQSQVDLLSARTATAAVEGRTAERWSRRSTVQVTRSHT